MIFISYYTKNTPYEKVILDCLIPGLKKFNLEYDIQPIEDLGSWQANTGYKAKFIDNMLNKHCQPVCFLDADAKIVKYPELLFSLPDNIDIAYHNFDWYLHWRNLPDQGNFHLLSGTMVWYPTEKSFQIIKKWNKEVQNNLKVWEQKILEQVINNQDGVNIKFLPAEYCCVLMHDYSIPKYIKDPVIIHTQASRKYKQRRNWID